MPITFPVTGHVMSIHRSDLQKRLWPNDKDEELAGRHACEKPRRQAKPPIEIRAPSPYNRFPSRNSVIHGIDRLRDVGSHGALYAQVTAHLKKHVLAERAGPTVILVGEQHGTPASNSMLLSAMSHVRDWSSKKLLLELATSDERGGDIEHVHAGVVFHARRFTQCVQHGTKFIRPYGNAFKNNLVVAAIYARLTQFDVGPHDRAKNDSPDNDFREQVMLNVISNQLADTRVTVVQTGSHHVPFLHDQFSKIPDVVTVSIMQIVPPVKGDSDTLPRLSYALATDAILKIKTAKDFDTTPLDASRFIRAHGLLAPRPPA
jgi:hypothetical protein